MIDDLTPEDRKTLDYIEYYIDHYKKSPTIDEVQNHMGFLSRCKTTEHINKIAKKGYLKREDYSYRGISIRPILPFYEKGCSLIFLSLIALKNLQRKYVFEDLRFKNPGPDDSYALEHSKAIAYLNFAPDVQFICILDHKNYECIILKNGREHRLNQSINPTHLVERGGSVDIYTNVAVSRYMVQIQDII